MSQDDVERLRRGLRHFAATGEFLAETSIPISSGTCPPSEAGPTNRPPRNRGREGEDSEWLECRGYWEIEAEDDIDAGERIVVVLRQRGGSKADGVPLRHAPRPGVDASGRPRNPAADVRDPAGSPRNAGLSE